MWPCARYGSCESTVGANATPKEPAALVPRQVSVPILTSTNKLRLSALTHPAIANETGYGQPVFIGRIFSLGGLRGSSQIPQLRMLPPVHLGKTSGLVHPVEPLDSCVPLQISIGSVPLSLFIREEALLEPATRRYREFTHNSENGFPIVLKKTGKRPQEDGGFSYLLDDARLILRSQGAEFHGVRHEYALDSLLRILLTMVLLPQRGFLLHAATVVRDGRAYVFTGRPAAGQNEHYPIAGIYTLVQSPEDRVESLTTKEMIRALLPCVLFFTSRVEANEDLLRLLLGFVAQVPCQRLHFRRDDRFWKVIAA